MSFSTLRTFWVGGLVLGAAFAQAQLVKESPFVSASSAPPPPEVSTSGPIEFRGVLEMADGLYFSIYDTAKKRSTWVKVGQPGKASTNSSAFTVTSYKAGNNQVVVNYQGMSQTLGLKRDKIKSTGTPLPAPPPPPGGAGITAGAAPPPSAAPALPAGASLEEWAAQVQKMRDTRAATTTPATPSAPAAPATAR